MVVLPCGRFMLYPANVCYFHIYNYIYIYIRINLGGIVVGIYI